jgi:hypothetical protein
MAKNKRISDYRLATSQETVSRLQLFDEIFGPDRKAKSSIRQGLTHQDSLRVCSLPKYSSSSRMTDTYPQTRQSYKAHSLCFYTKQKQKLWSSAARKAAVPKIVPSGGLDGLVQKWREVLKVAFSLANLNLSKHH